MNVLKNVQDEPDHHSSRKDKIKLSSGFGFFKMRSKSKEDVVGSKDKARNSPIVQKS
jgi:hypothetical protein